jgi:protein TonB
MSAATMQVVSRPVRPAYPLDAKKNNVQGAVVLHAIVDKEGNVQSVEVVSGPPILAGAASEAVKQWHFKPGQATGSEAQITVNFSIEGHAAAATADKSKQAP